MKIVINNNKMLCSLPQYTSSNIIFYHITNDFINTAMHCYIQTVTLFTVMIYHTK